MYDKCMTKECVINKIMYHRCKSFGTPAACAPLEDFSTMPSTFKQSGVVTSVTSFGVGNH